MDQHEAAPYLRGLGKLRSFLCLLHSKLGQSLRYLRFFARRHSHDEATGVATGATRDVGPSVDEGGDLGRVLLPPLVIIAAAIGGGIFVDRFVSVFPAMWLLLFVLFFAAWTFLWLWGFYRSAGFFLLGATAALFGLHHHLFWKFYPSDDIAFYYNPSRPMVYLRAVVREEPRLRPPPPESPFAYSEGLPTTVIGGFAQALRDGDRWIAVSGRVTLVVQGEVRNLRTGDVVEVLGHLTGLREPQNPGEPLYSAERRAARTLCSIYIPFPACVKKVGTAAGMSLPLFIARWRGHHNQVLERLLSPQSYGLVTAILLGIREGIDPEVTSAFRETGLLHFLAISGLHVGLLGAIACTVFGVVFRRWRVVLVAVALAMLLYMTLTDTRASVLRAGTLFVLGAVAQLVGRKSWGINLLATTAICVLVVQPGDLFRVGAHLTFLGTAALMWFDKSPLAPRQPSPTEWLTTRPGYLAIYLGGLWRAARDIFCVSLWISLIVWPYLAWQFHVVSLVGPFLTVLLWPMIVALMAGGLALLGCDAIFPPAATLLAFGCEGLTWAIHQLASIGRQIPGAFFWTAGPPGWWVAGFYLILAGIAAVPAFRKRGRGFVLVAAWVIGSLVVGMLGHRVPAFRCTFLAVGHGLCVVIQSGDGPAVLYDAGSLRHPQQLGPQLSHVLWSLGIRRIGAIILSHPDRDHYNLVPELLRYFPVERIFVGPDFGAALRPEREPFGQSTGQENGPGTVHEIRPSWFHRWVPVLHWSGYLPPVPILPGEPSDPSSPPADSGAEVGVEMLRAILRKARTPVTILGPGDSIRLSKGGVRLKVLLAWYDAAVPDSRRGRHDNATSLVVGVEYQDLRILLTGDLEPPGTFLLLDQPPWRSHVMLIPHHGSVSARSELLIGWTQPQAVVISGGRRWFRPQTLVTFAKLGPRVFHTYLHGAILVEAGRTKCTTKPALDPPRNSFLPPEEGCGPPYFRILTHSSGAWRIRMTSPGNNPRE